MSAAVTALVVLAIAVLLGLAVSRGLDPVGLVILLFIFAIGALAIVVARRSRSGRVQPAMCDECGGVISRNAPYCKHCGARVS